MAERNPRAATAVARRVKDVASLLAEYPLSGREVDESGVRMASLVRYPFLVFYAVMADEVGDPQCVARSRAMAVG